MSVFLKYLFIQWKFFHSDITIGKVFQNSCKFIYSLLDSMKFSWRKCEIFMEKMRNIIEFIGTSAMLIYLSGLQRHFSQISLNRRKILLKSLKLCYCILFFINKWCRSMHLLAKIFFSWKIRPNAQLEFEDA